MSFQEYEYEAIVPTPSLTTSVHTLQLGGRQTEVRTARFMIILL